MTQTALQDQRQNEQAYSGYQASQPAPIDSGSTVPPFYQVNHVASEMAKNPQITPPTTGEIHKQMWVGSMMMGLMTTLATGNVAGGIVGGMWAAIGVHDYGNALQQRAQYVDRLKGDGYSFPAILKWYEDGDSRELDKERQDFLQRDRMKQQDDEFQQRQAQQDRQFNQRQALQEREFNQREAMQGARLAQMIAHQHVMERIAQSNSESGRIAAIAKMGAAAGGMPGAGAGSTGAAGGGVPGVQLASFDPSKVPLPTGSENWSEREKAAYIQAAGQAYKGQQIADVAKQITSIKNLRTSFTQRAKSWDSVADAVEKGLRAPHTAGGDLQKGMGLQVAESPTIGARSTQARSVLEHMSMGPWDTVRNKISEYGNMGMSDTARDNADNVLKGAAHTQFLDQGRQIKNVMDSEGYNYEHPEIMRGLVEAFHAPPLVIKGIAEGTITPEQYADMRLHQITPTKTSDFGELPQSKDDGQKPKTGSW